MSAVREISNRIAIDILRDIESRKGLQNEWDEIEPEIQDEIVDEWARLIEERLRSDFTFTSS